MWCYGAAEVFSNPVFFEQIAEDYPDVNIIMGRMGLQYDNASAVVVGKRHKNVFRETSSSMDFNTLRAMKTAGIDQVLSLIHISIRIICLKTGKTDGMN